MWRKLYIEVVSFPGAKGTHPHGALATLLPASCPRGPRSAVCLLEASWGRFPHSSSTGSPFLSDKQDQVLMHSEATCTHTPQTHNTHACVTHTTPHTRRTPDTGADTLCMDWKL